MNLRQIIVPDRIETEEILDRDELPIQMIEETFDDLRIINRYFGGFGVYKKTLYKLIQSYSHDRHISILDVGAGSAEITCAVLNGFGFHSDNIAITGLDVQHRFLQLARRRNPKNPQLNLITSDAFRMPFKDNSFDIVISNLFIHHYYERTLELIAEMHRVARYAVVINDLIRHRIPLIFFKLFSSLFVQSPVTKYDGIVSLRRAFSSTEIRKLIESSNYLDYYFVTHWSFRFGLVIRKKRW